MPEINELNELTLNPFDVIFYDCSAVDGVDHVGMVLGNNKNGDIVFIETGSNDPGRKLQIIAPNESRYDCREKQVIDSEGPEIVGIKRYM